MTMEIAEYMLAALAAISASYILFTNQILYAAFSLVVTFLSLAVLYLLAGAEFVAATQIMIYVGGIIVLIIFGVMLTNERSNAAPKSGGHNYWLASVLSIAFFGMLVWALHHTQVPGGVVGKVSVKELGEGMITDYLLPFELAAILLLLALIGASVVAGHKNSKA